VKNLLKRVDHWPNVFEREGVIILERDARTSQDGNLSPH
jgi:hypothetical protein